MWRNRGRPGQQDSIARPSTTVALARDVDQGPLCNSLTVGAHGLLDASTSTHLGSCNHKGGRGRCKSEINNTTLAVEGHGADEQMTL